MIGHLSIQKHYIFRFQVWHLSFRTIDNGNRFDINFRQNYFFGCCNALFCRILSNLLMQTSNLFDFVSTLIFLHTIQLNALNSYYIQAVVSNIDTTIHERHLHFTLP